MRRGWIVALVASSGCELVLPIHESDDSGADVVAQDAEAGNPNALVAPGFDGAGGSCGFPWNPTSTSTVTLSRPDAGVCRVCVTKQGAGVTQHVVFADSGTGHIQLLYGAFVAAVSPASSASVLVQLDVHLRDGGRNFWPQPQIATTISTSGKQVDLNADNGMNALQAIDFNVLDENDASAGICFDVVAPYLDAIVQ